MNTYNLIVSGIATVLFISVLFGWYTPSANAVASAAFGALAGVAWLIYSTDKKKWS
jgi:hypothetical protein